MNQKFSVMSFQQLDKTIYMGYAKPSEIKRVSKIDEIDPKLPFNHKDQGYQRSPLEPRRKKIARYRLRGLEDGTIFPVPLILATRGKANHKDGVLFVNSDNPLYLIDGGNRLTGTMDAIEKNPAVDDIPLPFIVIEDPEGDRNLELQLFRDINSTAVKVPTDHVNAIIASKWAETPIDDIPRNLRPKVILTRALTDLSKMGDGCWHKQINIVPDLRTSGKGFVVKKGKAGSFLLSLSPLYRELSKNEKFLALSTQQAQAKFLASMLYNYWKVIARLNPKAIADYENNCIQKSQGIKGFHDLLRSAMIDNANLDISEVYFENYLKQFPKAADDTLWKKGGPAWTASASHNAEIIPVMLREGRITIGATPKKAKPRT